LGLAKANAELVLDLQCRRPVKTATLDVDATVIRQARRQTLLRLEHLIGR
jgi:hypothetical protein